MNPPTGITIVAPQEVVKTVKNLGEGLVVDFSPFVPGGPFTPGWPYNPATCPACQGTPSAASPASAIRDEVLNSVRTLTMNAASIASGGDVRQNVVENVVKNVVTGNEVGFPNGQQDIQAPDAGLHTPSTRSGEARLDEHTSTV